MIDGLIEIERFCVMDINVGKTWVKRISRAPSPVQITVVQKQREYM
jgi:hypothetical protein